MKCSYSGRDVIFSNMCYCAQTGSFYTFSCLEHYLEALNLVGVDF